MNVNNFSDWLNEAANALDDKDIMAVDELQKISENWMQTDTEKAAQLKLLTAIIDALDEQEYLRWTQ